MTSKRMHQHGTGRKRLHASDPTEAVGWIKESLEKETINDLPPKNGADFFMKKKCIACSEYRTPFRGGIHFLI
jgi:hypothetical protein